MNHIHGLGRQYMAIARAPGSIVSAELDAYSSKVTGRHVFLVETSIGASHKAAESQDQSTIPIL